MNYSFLDTSLTTGNILNFNLFFTLGFISLYEDQVINLKKIGVTYLVNNSMAYLMYWTHSEKSALGTFSGASNSSEKESLYSGVLRAFLQCNCGRKNECHFLHLSKKYLNNMKNQTEKIRYSHWSPAAGESAVEVEPIGEGFEE